MVGLRPAAAMALAELGHADAIPALQHACKVGSTELRAAASYALLTLDASNSLTAMLNGLNDSSSEVRLMWKTGRSYCANIVSDKEHAGMQGTAFKSAPADFTKIDIKVKVVVVVLGGGSNPHFF